MQNYKNHVQMVPGFHYVLTPLALLTMLAALVYWVVTLFNDGSLIIPTLIFLISIVTTTGLFFTRLFATKVQDRAIRAEENLRHYVLTGELLHTELTIKQIVALRFASDEEYPELCKKAVENALTPDEIKKEIQDWRADYNRV